jgi:hypothetical protein
MCGSMPVKFETVASWALKLPVRIYRLLFRSNHKIWLPVADFRNLLQSAHCSHHARSNGCYPVSFFSYCRASADVDGQKINLQPAAGGRQHVTAVTTDTIYCQLIILLAWHHCRIIRNLLVLSMDCICTVQSE